MVLSKRRSVLSYMFPPLVLLFLLLAVSVAFFSFRNFRQLIFQEQYHRLETAGELLLTALPFENGELETKAKEITRKIGPDSPFRVTFIKPDGSVFADSHEDPLVMENHAHRVEIRQAIRGEASFSLRKSPTLAISMLYYAFPIDDAAGKVIAVLRLSLPEANVKKLLAAAALSITIITALLLGLAVAAMVAVSRKITVPLAAISKSASAYARFDFSQPIHVDGPAEIVNTADALQKMAQALTSRIDEVTRQKQELEAVLTGMNEAVIVLDRNLVITEINPAAARLVSSSYDPVIGKSLIQVMRNTELNTFAQEALVARGVRQCSLVIPGEAKEIHLQVNASTIEAVTADKNSRYPQQRLILVMNDITTLKQLERMRKEFVANVSHELKTPITSIKGFVETLLDGAIDDRENAFRFLTIVQNQTTRLGNIIDDLLTLSRLEQNDEESGISMEKIPLCHPVNEAISICQGRADEKSIDIHVECDRELEILGNGHLIEQAVVNLVDNAVKYCPEGSVVLVRCEREEDRRILLVVQDNGPGIPEADQERIFERFYRVEKARSRDMGGTGLGLAIVKHIMLLHGGTVALESSRGEGASFLLRFPALPS